MQKQQKIRFKNPPVSEVAIGIGFTPLMLFRAQHVGLFWSVVREHFPDCQNVPPIGMPFAAPDETFPLTRFWFISADDANVIQFQRDRFYLNWRRRKGGESYSSFPDRSASFYSKLKQLERFIADHNLGSIAIEQAELTYTNHFSSESGWKSLDDTKKILRSFDIINTGDLEAENDNVLNQVSFKIRGDDGTLSIKLQTGLLAETREPVLIYELKRHIVRSFDKKNDLELWFIRANEDLDRIFESSTTQEAQTQLWGKVTSQSGKKR